jgi:two-component system, cell cycle response regulator DivK
LKIARARLPDLILMDIQLPGMSGIDALKALRAAPATAGIPVIAITASVMQQDRKQIMSAGFNGFIEKPINLRNFLDTVQRAVKARTA